MELAWLANCLPPSTRTWLILRTHLAKILVACAYNLRAREAEPGGSGAQRSYPSIFGYFQANERQPCLKKK